MKRKTLFVSLIVFVWASSKAPGVRAATPGYPETVIQWTVTTTETCEDIAKAVYGSAKYVDLVQRYNDVRCRPGVPLKKGTTLVIPEKVNYPPRARIQSMKSPVRARPAGGSWSPAQTGMPLQERSAVNTLEKARADIRFLDRTHVFLAQNTLVVIYGTASQTRVTHQKRVAAVRLDQGEVQAGLAALRGTPMTIEVQGGGKVEATSRDAVLRRKKKRTTVSVFDGRVRVSSAGKQVVVPAKMGSSFVDRRPPTPPRPLPPAPKWTSSSARGVLLVTPESNAFTISWEPVPRAVSYRVELARDEKFLDLVARQEVPARITNFRAERLEPGRYFVRVRAIDDEDFLGLTDAPATVILVVSDLAGGSMSDGKDKLQLSPYGIVRLHAPQELELALDDGPFGPVPEQLDLAKYHPKVLRFRAKGGKSEKRWRIDYEDVWAGVTARKETSRPGVSVRLVVHGIPAGSPALDRVTVRLTQGKRVWEKRLSAAGKKNEDSASPTHQIFFSGVAPEQGEVTATVLGPNGEVLGSATVHEPVVRRQVRQSPPPRAGVSQPVYSLSDWASIRWWTPRTRTEAQLAVAGGSGLEGWTGQVRCRASAQLDGVGLEAEVPTPGFGDDRWQVDDTSLVGTRLWMPLDSDERWHFGQALRLWIPVEHEGPSYRIEAGFALSHVTGSWSFVADLGAKRDIAEATGPAHLADTHGYLLVGGTRQWNRWLRGYVLLDGHLLHVEQTYGRAGLAAGVEVGTTLFGSVGLRVSPWQDGSGLITGQLGFGARL